jgi:hypothetical protein
VQPRQLEFQNNGQVTAELDRLRQGGYERAGNWDLAQVCDHLRYFIEGSLDGHQFQVPWVIKILFGRLVLWRILGQGRMKAGITTPQKPLPLPGGDEAGAVDRLKRVLQRLDAHAGEFHASPFFGKLTPAEWRQLHLIHCAHHLGFLIPKNAEK